MKWRDLLEFVLYLGTFFFLLWCLFSGAGYFFDCERRMGPLKATARATE